MLKKIFTSTALAGLAVSLSFAAFSADEFTLMQQERIGKLRIGLPEAEATKAIPCKLKRGPEQFWGADGAYHQEWKSVDCGITLGMVSEQKGSAKTIASITLVSPSPLKTKRGIRIGSTEQEVMAAYKPDWNREESSPSKQFVAGSIYGGLIFSFTNGKVSRIFLGAAAE
uniref:Uncharacterized protein n=1 Tax=Cyanothece sp. (strain PCC 7425 / ATCC 29141) TaxID=395961 RepID=B8HR91_CYAP4